MEGICGSAFEGISEVYHAIGGSASMERNRDLQFLGSFLEVKKAVPAEHLSGGRDFHG
jgi:hypothetical protein